MSFDDREFSDHSNPYRDVSNTGSSSPFDSPQGFGGPRQNQPSWISQNWFWFIPLIFCFSCCLCCCGGGVSSWVWMQSYTSHPAFQQSIESINGSQEAKEITGGTVDPDSAFVMQVSEHTGPDGSNLRLDYEITSSDGSSINVRLIAEKRNGQWVITDLEIRGNGSTRIIIDEDDDGFPLPDLSDVFEDDELEEIFDEAVREAVKEAQEKEANAEKDDAETSDSSDPELEE